MVGGFTVRAVVFTVVKGRPGVCHYQQLLDVALEEEEKCVSRSQQTNLVAYCEVVFPRCKFPCQSLVSSPAVVSVKPKACRIIYNTISPVIYVILASEKLDFSSLVLENASNTQEPEPLLLLRRNQSDAREQDEQNRACPNCS